MYLTVFLMGTVWKDLLLRQRLSSEYFQELAYKERERLIKFKICVKRI